MVIILLFLLYSLIFFQIKTLKNNIFSICMASLIAQLVKNPPAMWETWIQFLDWEDPIEKERLPTPVLWHGEFHGLENPMDGGAW